MVCTGGTLNSARVLLEVRGCKLTREQEMGHTQSLPGAGCAPRAAAGGALISRVMN